jgi:hypothetical protein
VKKAMPLPAAQPAIAKTAASQPATAKPAVIRKPAPAELQFALVAAPEFEHAFASLAPDRPRRQPGLLLTELPHGRAVAWETGVEIANSIARPMEPKLDLREVSRTTPRIGLDLRIVPPESLETENRPLTIPIALAEPANASLWIGPHRDFTGEMASLSDFADAQFSKSDFEAPVLATGSDVSAAVAQPLAPEPQPAALTSEPPPLAEVQAVTTVAEPLGPEPQAEVVEGDPRRPETNTSFIPTFRVPDPELNPIAISSTGIAPARAKPLPVFGPTPVSAGTIQISQPNGLPLRPVMVLATPAPNAEVKHRKAGVLSVGSALSIKPSLSVAPNLGLPELPAQASAGPITSRMPKILAALTGAVVLGAGIFFFPGNRSDAGLKSATPAVADGALGGQWITNFAPDAQRQRRISLLRSSMNRTAYRLDFESSIRIKSLGWVYRAQDSKNFYVSKIELQKPGESLAYALVHYAVIDGVEQRREEAPLHVTVPLGGLYKIRFDAVGNRFTTWVQDQQVAQWTDSRLSSGGAGLYSEGAERSTLHGDFVVTPLMK